MMNPRDTQVRFWKVLADRLAAGQNLGTALREGAIACGECAPLVRDIDEGRNLSDAMAGCGRPVLFSPAAVAMMRMGELGGVLDIATRHIAEAMEDGSLMPEMPATSERLASARFLTLFGHLLGCGVPLLSALEEAGREHPGDSTRELVTVMRSAVEQGGSLARALASRWPEIIGEIERAEQAGNLDQATIELGRRLMTQSTGVAGISTTAAAIGKSAANKLILEAVKEHAADIHLDPAGVRFRIDGVLHPRSTPDGASIGAIIDFFKSLCGLDPEKRNLPQDGRVMMNVNEVSIDFALSTIPIEEGERMTIRILRRSALNLDYALVVPDPENRRRIDELIHRSSGVVLCAGPAGSGKTTLMYTMLMQLDRTRCNVLSIEDPVEFKLPGVAQVQVNTASGLTYVRALRLVLRQDPDVVMVGEIMDSETLMACLTVAMTGHLVFSQMHTNSAPATISRLLDLGAEPFVLNSALGGVVAQRLVRKLCPQCRKPVIVALQGLPADAQKVLQGVEPTFYAPGRCAQCNQTGFRGRTTIHEILAMTPELRDAVTRRASGKEIHQIAQAGGMRTLLQDGALLAAKGETTLEEVLSVVPLAL